MLCLSYLVEPNHGTDGKRPWSPAVKRISQALTQTPALQHSFDDVAFIQARPQARLSH